MPTEEEAKDLVQDTLIRAWRVDPDNPHCVVDKRYDPSIRPSFYSWCRYLMRHILSDRSRHAKPRPLSLDYQRELVEEGFTDDSLVTPDIVEGALESRAYVVFMDRLTDIERDLVDGLMIGLSMEEATERVGISVEDGNKLRRSLQHMFMDLSGKTELLAMEEEEGPLGAYHRAMKLFG